MDTSLRYPRLAIVVINHNLAKDTVECIVSFLGAGAVLPQIFCVDNGSTDNSAEVLRQQFGEQLNLIREEQIRGYAHGLNLGITRALEFGYDWLLLMSNDTLVASDFLTELTAVAEEGRYELIGPAIFYREKPDHVWFIGNHLLPGTMIARDPYRGKVDKGQFAAVIEVDFLNGCSLLAHRHVMEKVGRFDTSFFMYAEEVDFLWRARRAGVRMAAATRAKMWHKISATMQADKPGSRYLRIRNQIWVYRRYGTPLQKALMLVFTSLRAAGMACADLARGQGGLISPLARGMKDGWLGKIPQPSE